MQEQGSDGEDRNPLKVTIDQLLLHIYFYKDFEMIKYIENVCDLYKMDAARICMGKSKIDNCFHIFHIGAKDI